MALFGVVVLVRRKQQRWGILVQIACANAPKVYDRVVE